MIVSNQNEYTLVCDDPTPDNGYAQLPNGRTFGSSAFLTCETDYSLIGDSLIECLHGGVWSDTPYCVESKYINICEIVYQNVKSHFNDKAHTFGAAITYKGICYSLKIIISTLVSERSLRHCLLSHLHIVKIYTFLNNILISFLRLFRDIRLTILRFNLETMYHVTCV